MLIRLVINCFGYFGISYFDIVLVSKYSICVISLFSLYELLLAYI